MNSKKTIFFGLSLALALVSAGCGGGSDTNSSYAKPPAETKAKAEEILAKMTEKVKAAPAFSFKTTEITDRVKRGGEMAKLNITRTATFRGPDKMYFKTTGDRELEVFYDGKDMTLITHKDKVWGKLVAPPTVAETVQKVREFYGMPLPVVDLLGFDAKGHLRNAANTSSIDKKETVGGVECNVLAFKNADVDWEVWIPVSGDPLPKKFHAKYKTGKQPESTIEFTEWNLAPQITDDTFVAKVPEDYEGIPIIQRADAVVAKIEEEEKKAAADTNTNAPAPEAGKK